jgi:cytoskeleton protein RodZ
VPAAPALRAAPSAADPAKPDAVADATPAAGQTTSPAREPSLGTNRVVLRANDDCWIEIRDSTGAIVVSRLMRRGESFPVPTRPGLLLTVGNASALSLVLDGKTLPPLGKAGMVRHDVQLDPDRLAGAAPAGAAND